MSYEALRQQAKRERAMSHRKNACAYVLSFLEQALSDADTWPDGAIPESAYEALTGCIAEFKHAIKKEIEK